MSVCTFDFAFTCFTREGTAIPPAPSILSGISRKLPLSLLAGVLLRGDEASVGGDECDAYETMIARLVTSFVITCA